MIGEDDEVDWGQVGLEMLERHPDGNILPAVGNLSQKLRKQMLAVITSEH